MPMSVFTKGSLYGKFNGSSIAFAFDSSNANNPNASQQLDLFQIHIPGGKTIFRVDYAGNVTFGSGVSGPTFGTMIARVLGSNALGVDTAAHIMAATFPLNYNGAKQDIFQIASDVEMNAVEAAAAVAGGDVLIYRLDYAGAKHTS
jgi:hypothetical protein